MTRRRDPVERLVDVTIAVPVGAAVAAGRVASIALHAGCRRLQRWRPGHDPAGGVGDGLDLDDRDDTWPVASAGDPPPSIDAATLPIDDYDHLAARQVIAKLAALTADELHAVESYERTHRHRQTVLGRIAQLRP